MHKLLMHCSVGLFFLIFFSFFSCGRASQLGGQCQGNSDCDSDVQYVPGTTCQDGVCKCADPNQQLCCEGEDVGSDCFLECRPCDKCSPGWPGCQSAPETCKRDTDCPGPPDARCGAGRCVDDKCEIELHQGPLASQRRGDCEFQTCTYQGEVITVSDPSDTYDDGQQCTSDTCIDQSPRNEPLVEGATCPGTHSGRCHEGVCVECIDTDPNGTCAPGLACDGLLCVPGHCVNLRLDAGLGEADYDCGGACHPCQPGLHCRDGIDCSSGVCIGGLCRRATCSDGVKNDSESGSETGIDCGAPACPLCPPNQGCKTASNCTSGVCWASICQTPTCIDGVKNGDEGGVDCGAPNCPPCRP